MSGKEKTVGVSEESALEQIQILLDYYGIDKGDIEKIDAADALQTIYNTLQRAIQKGVLEISMADGKFQILHHLCYPQDEVSLITYLDKVPKAKMAAGKISKNQQEAQAVFMGCMAGGLPSAFYLKLKGFDETLTSRLSLVFSMV